MASTSSSHNNYNQTDSGPTPEKIVILSTLGFPLQQLQSQIYHPWFNASQVALAYKFTNYIRNNDRLAHTELMRGKSTYRVVGLKESQKKHEFVIPCFKKHLKHEDQNQECKEPSNLPVQLWMRGAQIEELSKELKSFLSGGPVAVSSGSGPWEMACSSLSFPGIQVARHVCIATWAHTCRQGGN